MADEMVDLYQRVGEQVVRDRNRSLADLRQNREWIDETFHHLRAVISDIAEDIAQFTTLTGQVVKRVGQLDGTGRILDDLIVRLRDEWPVATRAEVEEALTAAGRSEALDLDEAFAQIAGMDKDAWLRRVEEHKRGGQKGNGEE